MNYEKRKLFQKDFAIPANHRVKVTVYEKIVKYLKLARELKKNC